MNVILLTVTGMENASILRGVESNFLLHFCLCVKRPVEMERWKRRLSGGFLAVTGYLLSPLSWWNDAIINVPLALAFAWVVSLFYKPAFEASVILGYWLTNVAGFVLMHKGGQQLLSNEEKKYSWKAFARDIVISLLYTGLIVLLVKMKIFQPAQDYFSGMGSK